MFRKRDIVIAPNLAGVIDLESRFRNERRCLCGWMAAGVLLPVAGWLAVPAAWAQQDPPAQGILSLGGTASINGRPARKFDLVRSGDVVATGPDSYAVFVAGGDAFLVRAATRVELGSSREIIDSLRLVTGKLLSVFAGGKGRRTLQTATATIGIRGTGAYLEAEPERTYFCLCYGEADIIPVAQPAARTTIQTAHHDSPHYIIGDTQRPPIEESHIENHQDAELILLESLVGREPPFMRRGSR
jgi:hypothetical protein